MSTKPSAPDTPGIDLDQVRNTGDASVWLRQEAARHAAEATECSPVRARALGLTGSTLEVYATVVGTYRDPAGIGAELARLADDYRHPDRDAVEPIPKVHRLACEQLGSTLGDLAVRLLHLARPQPLPAKRRSCRRPPDRHVAVLVHSRTPGRHVVHSPRRTRCPDP